MIEFHFLDVKVGSGWRSDGEGFDRPCLEELVRDMTGLNLITAIWSGNEFPGNATHPLNPFRSRRNEDSIEPADGLVDKADV